VIEHQIRRRVLRHLSIQDQDAIKAKPRRGRGSLTTVIGLQRAASDQSPGALFLRFGNEKFQFASFVTAKGETGLVVALDQNARSAQKLRKTREFFDWRRQMSKMEAGNIIHSSFSKYFDG